VWQPDAPVDITLASPKGGQPPIDPSKGADWADHAVADGNLITGQNPASSESTARLLLKQLEAGLGMTAGAGAQRR
jgi:putative intracellular protease/amidase